jgi:hypothetical protein
MSQQYPEGFTPDPMELDDDYVFPPDDEGEAVEPDPDALDTEPDFPVDPDTVVDVEGDEDDS